MALTEVDICNLALGRIAQPAIVALTDADDEGVQCNLHFDPTRDALLRAHPWRFASKWADLVQDEEADSGTSTDDTNTSTKLYDTGQTWVADVYNAYYLWITGGTGSGQIRLISDTAATYITVGTAFTTTPDDTSTYEVWENYPPYPWAYQYDLPSDFLRFTKTYPLHELFEINGTLLRSDESAVCINYVWEVTDPDSFDALFVEALVVALAAKLCMALLHDKTWYRELAAEAERALARARLINQQEVKARPTTTSWLSARY